MDPETIKKKDLCYTAGHEWIDFHNSEAVVGITSFRLTGVKQIKSIELVRVYGFKKRGDVLANIQFDKGRIQVRMPVDGSITAINDMDLLVSQDLLLTKSESDGWLVKILVRQPCTRTGLMSSQGYNSMFA